MRLAHDPNCLPSKERPILFNAPMVCAVIARTKGQTRRLFKARNGGLWPNANDLPGMRQLLRNCPYGKPGDRLWVRETWQHSNHPYGPYDAGCMVFYRADFMNDSHGPDGEKSSEGRYRTWRPAIHMPRSACRLVLPITAIRLGLLQDISEEDCIAEGIQRYQGPLRWMRYLDAITGEACHNTARAAYAALWDHINGTGSWDSNPWVWAIEFHHQP